MPATAKPIPEVALGVACLTTIAPHLAGVYCATLEEERVRLQGRADDVEHLIAALHLTRTDRLDHTDKTGNRYETWQGPGPGEFATVTITLVVVHPPEEA